MKMVSENDPIKIRWTGDARKKLVSREIVVALEDGEPHGNPALETMDRQKTNVVIHSETEARAVYEALERIRMRSPSNGNYGCVWMTHAHVRAYDRVYRELKERMEAHGIPREGMD